MRVALSSIFRNAADYLPRWHAQVVALNDLLNKRGDMLRCLVAEGDSTDRTFGLLGALDLPRESQIFKADHGGPAFGSVIVPQRMAQMAYVQNVVRQAVSPEDDNVWVYVEGDLIWKGVDLLRLIDAVSGDAILAPMVMHHTGRWYDSWGYRLNGRAFAFHPPYHPDLPDPLGEALIPLDTAGSCLAMPASVARRVRFLPEDCIVGLCRDAAAQGIPTYLDPRVAVVHPPDGAD